MAIRKPVAVTSIEDTVGTTASYYASLPMDSTNAIFKLYGTLTGTSPTCDAVIYTTDDGGSTWYVIGEFAQMTATIANADALWIVAPVAGTAVTAGGYGFVGAAASAIVSKISGLPIMDKRVKITLTYGGTVGAADVLVDIKANVDVRT